MKINCPKCGNPGSLVERSRGERKYYEVWHYSKGNRYWCYLGPSIYLHGSSTNVLKLRGMIDPQRILEYLIEIRDWIPMHLPKLDLDELERVLDEMIQIVKCYRSAEPKPAPSEILEQMKAKSTENFPKRLVKADPSIDHHLPWK